MSRTASCISICLISLFVATTTFAQNNRSAVSVNGSDLNPCTIASPCRSFNAAIAQTQSGGEVIALDSAGYGPFTANRSVSVIAAPGVYAGVSVTSGDGVTLNAGGSVITLRNLSITGLGGTNGINDSATAQLYVENCTVSGFTSSGLEYTNGSNWANGNLVDISNSTFLNNDAGIYISAGNSFYVHTEIDNSMIGSNNYGIYINNSGFNRTTISRSRLVHNKQAALDQLKNGGVSALTEIESCVLSGNNNGIISDGIGGPSYVYLSNSTVAGNEGTAIVPTNGGFIYTRQNNTVENNVTAGTFTGPYTAH